MGLIVCDIHGESGFMPFVSIGLSEKIFKREVIESKEIRCVDVELFDDDELLSTLKYWMTELEFIEAGSKILYTIVTDEDEIELNKIFDPIIKRGGCCVNCFKDYMKIIEYP